jgi:hypothetical protein
VVEVIETADLGDRGNIARDGNRAVVVDPQRDRERAEERKPRCRISRDG